MAITFTGSSSQYVQLDSQNNLPQVQGPITVSLWFYYTTVPTSGNQGYYSQRDVVSVILDRSISIGNRAGSIGAWKNGGTFLVSTSAPSANVWHHIVYTCDGSNNNVLYLDGVSVNTSTTAADVSSGGMVQTTIGCINTLGGRVEFLTGSIEDVRVYNIVLTLSEIEAIYHTKGKDAIVNGLVSWWPLNENGTGTASGSGVVKDLADNNNNATPNASPTWSEGEIGIVRKIKAN